MSELKRVTGLVDGRYSPEATPESTLLEGVRQALSGMKHGEVTIYIRNGKVVEIESIARSRPHDSHEKQIAANADEP